MTARSRVVSFNVRQQGYVNDTPNDTVSDQKFSSGGAGWGCKHIYDTAPFSLWVKSESSFRPPSPMEVLWMKETYGATEIYENYPNLLIQTSEPPNPLPLTLGGALVRFLPPGVELHSSLPFGSPKPYPDILRNDLLSAKLPPFSIPSNEVCITIIDLLLLEMDIRSIHFLPPRIVVELDISTGRTYLRRSLPATAGGMIIIYHESVQGYFDGEIRENVGHVIEATTATVDDTDYLNLPAGTLRPGIKLSGPVNPTTRHCSSSSAGVLLQNGIERRLSLASHSFSPNEVDVYHPDPSGHHIGTITGRLPELDVAFAQLDPSVLFENSSYFRASTPRKLLRTTEINGGAWFELDGYTSGRVDVMAYGKSFSRGERLQEYGAIQPDDWDIRMIFQTVMATNAFIRDGMRGAPIVDTSGGVAGFFTFADHKGSFVYSNSLDTLLDEGWYIV